MKDSLATIRMKATAKANNPTSRLELAMGPPGGWSSGAMKSWYQFDVDRGVLTDYAAAITQTGLAEETELIMFELLPDQEKK